MSNYNQYKHKKWTLSDLLTIILIKKLPYKIKYNIIENHDSLEHFLNSPIDSKLSNYFAQTELFNNSNNFEAQIDIANQEIDKANSHSTSIISLWDNEYPALLQKTAYPPLVLYVKGELQNSNSICISVVGTRKNSTYGKLCTEKFVEEFVKNNLVIVSGLAYGIDTIAHKTAFEKKGKTYAVIASGIDKLSPLDSKKNAEKILENRGAIISDYPMGTTALPAYFLQRNRIIAGISLATIVIESGYKGGSLNTARHAFDLGREVFAIPGNISSKKSEGTNILIKNEKATLATSPKDILNELGLGKGSQNEIKLEENSIDNPEQQVIYELISIEPIHVDSISEKLDIDISHLLVNLLEMEFKGLIRQLPGKFYIRNNL